MSVLWAIEIPLILLLGYAGWVLEHPAVGGYLAALGLAISMSVNSALGRLAKARLHPNEPMEFDGFDNIWIGFAAGFPLAITISSTWIIPGGVELLINLSAPLVQWWSGIAPAIDDYTRELTSHGFPHRVPEVRALMTMNMLAVLLFGQRWLVVALVLGSRFRVALRRGKGEQVVILFISALFAAFFMVKSVWGGDLSFSHGANIYTVYLDLSNSGIYRKIGEFWVMHVFLSLSILSIKAALLTRCVEK